jgi:uncharacterized membrane protein
MNDPVDDPTASPPKLRRVGFASGLLRDYMRGLAVVAVASAIWFGLQSVASSLPVGRTGAASTGAAAVLAVVVPLVAGRALRLIDPWLSRNSTVRALNRAEEGVLVELAPGPDSPHPVVLVNWPSAQTRSLAVVTATYVGADGERYAAIYVPDVPSPATGILRVVAWEDVEVISWTVNELLAFNVSYGAVSPDRLTAPDTDGPR